MKIIPILALYLITLQMQAQTPPPGKHFRPGHVLLSDSTSLTGYIRDYMHPNASIVFLDAATGKKRTLTGAQLLSLDIDTTHYLCLKGDFFKIIAASDLLFLQKSSDASGKPAYNGTEPILVNGTEGRLNDYFLYDPAGHSLQLVNGKTVAHVIPTAFFKQK